MTDRQTQGEKQYISRPLQGGDIMSLIMKKSVSNIHELIVYQSDQEFCLEDLTVSM